MKISIIITNYNYGKYLARCIRSCISQSIEKKDFEIIVIDDNSKDNSFKVLKEFNKNIKLIHNKKNIGVSKSVNKAVKLAKGEYFVRVDADDYISSYLLTFLYNAFSILPDKFGVACDYYNITNNGKIISRVKSKNKPIACGILYNRKKFISYGMYNSKFRHREEEELRLRLGNKYKIHRLNLPLYKYRLHENNKTKSKEYLNIFKKKIEGLTTIKNKKEIKRSSLLKNIVAIIPARQGSKRFKNKNIFNIQGKPMIAWPIMETKKSSMISETYVSSESLQILDISKKFGAKIIERPKKLAQDNVVKLDVIRHSARIIESRTKKKISLILSIQANSPEIKMNHIEEAIKKLVNYNLQEVISADQFSNCNAAIRVMTRKALFQNSLSTDHGFLSLDITDIHYKNDLKKVNKL